MKAPILALFAGIAALASGCKVLEEVLDTGTPDDLNFDLSLDTTVTPMTANNSGRVRVPIEVTGNVASFQVTGKTEFAFVTLEQLLDPDGAVALDWQDWVGTPYSITNAFYIDRTTTAFDWPVRLEDGPLATGTWTAVLAVTDIQGRYRPGDPVDVYVSKKIDPDPDNAVVKVQIAWAEGVSSDPVVVQAVEDAVVHWKEIWGNHRITLEERYIETDLDPGFNFLFTGDPSVEAAAENKAPGELQLVIGETVMNQDYILGVSAGIPGTIEVSPHTFVVMSWLSHAGVDAAFDDEEIRIMGETMAHEIGHYMGLYHPVETTYANWDALDDTAECTQRSTCNDQLGENLMYPYPVCTFRACTPNSKISGEQTDVLQQYVGSL